MENVIVREQLPDHLFQGGEHGGIPISFFWVQSSPGGGPRLHKHPYEEIFVILEGHATVTLGESTLEVDGGIWQSRRPAFPTSSSIPAREYCGRSIFIPAKR